jgi:hypothetical protein
MRSSSNSIEQPAGSTGRSLLLESEVSTRNSRKLNRLVKSAGFAENAAFEDYDARASRGLDKALM